VLKEHIPSYGGDDEKVGVAFPSQFVYPDYVPQAVLGAEINFDLSVSTASYNLVKLGMPSAPRHALCENNNNNNNNNNNKTEW